MNTQNTSVVPFNFNSKQIRVVMRDGEPWFVAADVCKGLGMDITKSTFQWLNRLDAVEKGPIPQNLLMGKGLRHATLISESGLYKLIMRSDKPEAKAFQDWVTKEVLPSIRKTGSYVTGQPSLVENPKMDPLDLMMAQAELIPQMIARTRIDAAAFRRIRT